MLWHSIPIRGQGAVLVSLCTLPPASTQGVSAMWCRAFPFSYARPEAWRLVGLEQRKGKPYLEYYTLSSLCFTLKMTVRYSTSCKCTRVHGIHASSCTRLDRSYRKSPCRRPFPPSRITAPRPGNSAAGVSVLRVKAYKTFPGPLPSFLWPSYFPSHAWSDNLANFSLIVPAYPYCCLHFLRLRQIRLPPSFPLDNVRPNKKS